MPLSVAVIGSGPAGCYLVERLVREAPGCRIDVLDRLPTPYGLVRAGVAPDHQGSKAIQRVFERALTRDGVQFWGDVEVGRDVTLDELREIYDAVVLATGAPEDRRLGIPGEELSGVCGSGAFVRWYNGHPEAEDLSPLLPRLRHAVVIGNGNVAIDVARLLAKTAAETAQSDLDPAIAAAFGAAPLETVSIVGRRGAAEASFSPAELAELGTLARTRPVLDPADLPAEGAPDPAAVAVLRGFAMAPLRAAPVELRFVFAARPLRFEGEGRVERVVFARQRRDGGEWRATGEMLVLPADLAVTCIGYRSVACCDLAPADGVFANEAGRLAPGLYVVGWAKRGPSGTIATNRSESHEVAQRLAGEVVPRDRPAGAALEPLLVGRGCRPVDFAQWRRIDAAERERAASGRPRHKFPTRAALLAAARGEAV
jgi:ferredoxin--NADP+ reductase